MLIDFCLTGNKTHTYLEIHTKHTHLFIIKIKRLFLDVKASTQNKNSVFCFFDTFKFPSQTFEAKLLHIESRPGRKTKNSTTDLEFFMRCEVHSSDLDVFINTLKRVVDDVRSVPEEKGNYLILSSPFMLFLITGTSSATLQALLDVIV